MQEALKEQEKCQLLYEKQQNQMSRMTESLKDLQSLCFEEFKSGMRQSYSGDKVFAAS